MRGLWCQNVTKKGTHFGARKSHPNFGIKTSQKVVIILGQEYRPRPVVRKLHEKKDMFRGHENRGRLLTPKRHEKSCCSVQNIVCGLWCENDGKSIETRCKKVVVLGQEYCMWPMV